MTKGSSGCRFIARWLSPLVVLAASASAEESRLSFEPASAADPSCVEIQPDMLVPRVVDTSLSLGRARFCLPGTSNGQGYVALGVYDFFGYPSVDEHWVVKPRWGGTSTGTLLAYVQHLELLPQGDGWLTSEQSFYYGLAMLRSWPPGGSPNGVPLKAIDVPLESTTPPIVAPDFTSGLVVAFEDGNDALNLKVQRFTSDLTSRSAAVNVAVAAHGQMAAGVDADRATLILFDGATAGLPPGHTGGRWFDPCGAALTDVFDAAAYPISGSLVPLIDGSLVLQSNGQWVGRFTHLSTAPAGSAPAWLAARPDTRLAWIHHGNGYALTPAAGFALAECRQPIFLYSKTGAFCGTATFTVDTLPCTTGGINVGPDGTVVMLSPRSGACLDPPRCFENECIFSWWPSVLGCRGSGQRGEGCPGTVTGSGNPVPVTVNAQRPPDGTRPIQCGRAP